MNTTLALDEVLDLLKKTPEQGGFDWKADFTTPNDDDKRGEFIKDLAAIANSAHNASTFIFYGVDPRRPDPVVGITQRYDDAALQQLARGRIDPPPSFLYYELERNGSIVGVLQVYPTVRRPHIIAMDTGRVRKGQVLVRRGSSTDGATMRDLWEFFYGETSDHFQGVVQRLGLHIAEQNAQTAYIRELRAEIERSERDMEFIAGVPRGTLRR